MSLNIILGPIIGAIIGYCTNFIAVKMLFRPLKPIYIGKFKVPFTPGIIPKRRDSMAKAIGDAVGSELLTADDLKNTLLSDKLKEKVGEEAKALIKFTKDPSLTVDEKLLEYISEEDLNIKTIKISQLITDKVYNKVLSVNIGNVVANKVSNAINNKVKGEMIGMFINEDLINSFIDPIANEINEYINSNGKLIIRHGVDNEILALREERVCKIREPFPNLDENISDLAVNVYEKFINNKLESVLHTIDISNMVEEKICQMDLLDVENLLLSFMKKELNAIVNLGALIGFILGIIMIFA
ncbi:MAG: DUF445 family protein [Anaerovoracaceae bacterium]